MRYRFWRFLLVLMLAVVLPVQGYAAAGMVMGGVAGAPDEFVSVAGLPISVSTAQQMAVRAGPTVFDGADVDSIAEAAGLHAEPASAAVHGAAMPGHAAGHAAHAHGHGSGSPSMAGAAPAHDVDMADQAAASGQSLDTASTETPDAHCATVSDHHEPLANAGGDTGHAATNHGASHGQCTGCAPCCIGGVLTFLPALPSALPVAGQAFLAPAAAPAPVYLALPERPPRLAHA